MSADDVYRHLRDGTALGCIGRCKVCGKAIQLVRSRNPETHVDHDFWVHYAPLVDRFQIEMHKAVLNPGVCDA